MFRADVILELSFNAQKCGVTCSLFEKKSQGVMYGLFLGTCLSNLKSVSLTVLQLLAFNAQKCRGHVTSATFPFRKILKESCLDCFWKHACQIWTVSGNACMGFRDSPNMAAFKFEVRIFNRVEAISI